MLTAKMITLKENEKYSQWRLCCRRYLRCYLYTYTRLLNTNVKYHGNSVSSYRVILSVHVVKTSRLNVVCLIMRSANLPRK